MDVLLVDDEPAMLEQTKIYLEKEYDELEIDPVSSVKSALNLLDKHDYDVVVSDYMMPDKDGLELLKILRNDRDNDIPFIIFTGRSREDVAIEALNLGANRYLRKGGDPKSQYKVLVQAINQVVEHAITSKENEKMEEKLSSLVDGSGDYIYIVDEDCNILFANKAELKYHDLTLDEITEYKYHDLHQKEDTEQFEKKVKKVFETGEPQIHDFKQKDDQRYLTRTLSPLNNPNTEEVEAVSIISKDITERKKVEEKYKALFQQLTDSLFLEDTEGNILDVNDAACELLNYDYEELVGMNVGDLVPEEEPAFLPDEIDEATIKGKPLETKNKRKDGSIVPVELRGRIIELGEEKRMLVSIRDISERKEAEKKILEEKEKIEKLHDIAHEFEQCKSKEKIYDLIIDASENILGFDKLCSVEIVENEEVHLLALSKGEKKGYQNKPLSESGYVKKTYENKKSYIINDAVEDSEAEPVKNKYRSGISIPIGDRGVFQTVSPSKDAFDKEDLRLAELLLSHAEEALKRITSNNREEFLHSLLRHDVGNKTQIVHGYLKLLSEYDLTEEKNDIVQKALKACIEGQNIIEKVKTLRELDKEEEISSVNIKDVIKNTIEDNEYKTSENSIDIIYKDKDHLVKGGPLLQELFSNIIENSVGHSGCDKIKISSKEDDKEIVIMVEDDGKGISEKDRSKIFEKGYKKGENAGSGLGMYLVKEIAENYGGKVEIKDSQMGGAMFNIKLMKAN